MKPKIFGSLIVLEASYNEHTRKEFMETGMWTTNRGAYIIQFLVLMIHFFNDKRPLTENYIQLSNAIQDLAFWRYRNEN